MLRPSVWLSIPCWRESREIHTVSSGLGENRQQLNEELFHRCFRCCSLSRHESDRCTWTHVSNPLDEVKNARAQNNSKPVARFLSRPHGHWLFHGVCRRVLWSDVATIYRRLLDQRIVCRSPDSPRTVAPKGPCKILLQLVRARPSKRWWWLRQSVCMCKWGPPNLRLGNPSTRNNASAFHPKGCRATERPPVHVGKDEHSCRRGRLSVAFWRDDLRQKYHSTSNPWLYAACLMQRLFKRQRMTAQGR